MKGVLDGAVAGGLGGADWSELVAFAEQQAGVACAGRVEGGGVVEVAPHGTAGRAFGTGAV